MSKINYIDDAFIEEKIDGVIYLMDRPTDKHLMVQGNLHNIFNNYFRQNKRQCVAIFEKQLYINNENYVIPDLMIYCRHNRDETGDKNIPVIIIEVLSNSTWEKDLDIKMKKYAELGIKEYWTADYRNQRIDIYDLKSGKYEKHKSYACFVLEDYSIIPEIREKQQADAIKEFSPVSFPEMQIPLEEVFYFVQI